MRQPFAAAIVLLSPLCAICAMAAESLVLDAQMHHLRRGNPAEWSDFPAIAEGPAREIRFVTGRPTAECTLRLRQQDVKQTWHVSLNGVRVDDLRIDENDMVVYFSVRAELLQDGENILAIAQDNQSQAPDDIRVGEIELQFHPLPTVLSESTLEIEVRDSDTDEYVPARITVASDRGALQTVGARSDEQLAVRPGIVYTAVGRARFGIPPGHYRVWAGRGFEYSLATIEVDVAPGETVRRSLRIRREVPTQGYVACDTHVHTFTHSRHGDATIEERMVTLAGEGIELPIATDHNLHIDYESTARSLNVRQYFTPVMGNEVTTPVGHFNVFPVQPGARIPNARLTDWSQIFAEIYRTPVVKAVILNHARDLHSGVRPFGPILHNAVVGENLDGWLLRANAMEVINSAAIQTYPHRLFDDWMAMLNRGRMLTPVGASDSHDVGRHFVGQGRTYIRANDRHPDRIDIAEAVNSFVQGRVMVSYGLLAELTVDDKYGSGELAPVPSAMVRASVRVLGPHWVRADTVELFANGQRIRTQSLESVQQNSAQPGVLWSGAWEIERPKHDVHLVAIATGPGIEGLYWKTAKPYQPLSAIWKSRVVGCSGAVWLDADGDSRPTPAFDYAQRLVSQSPDLRTLLNQLATYDRSVAAQAAHLWHAGRHSLYSAESLSAIGGTDPVVRDGMQSYLDARRANHKARAEAGK